MILIPIDDLQMRPIPYIVFIILVTSYWYPLDNKILLKYLQFFIVEGGLLCLKNAECRSVGQ